MASVCVIQRHASPGRSDGQTIYGMAFTVDEIDYLDSRAESEARRHGAPNGEDGSHGADRPTPDHPSRMPNGRRPVNEGGPAFHAAGALRHLTKHMIRMRHHRDRSGQVQARPEANEVILINSHDGASSYLERESSPIRWPRKSLARAGFHLVARER
jgi:hypothetical protein